MPYPRARFIKTARDGNVFAGVSWVGHVLVFVWVGMVFMNDHPLPANLPQSYGQPASRFLSASDYQKRMAEGDGISGGDLQLFQVKGSLAAGNIGKEQVPRLFVCGNSFRSTRGRSKVDGDHAPDIFPS
jgi:hypothetical protein